MSSCARAEPSASVPSANRPSPRYAIASVSAFARNSFQRKGLRFARVSVDTQDRARAFSNGPQIAVWTFRQTREPWEFTLNPSGCRTELCLRAARDQRSEQQKAQRQKAQCIRN